MSEESRCVAWSSSRVLVESPGDAPPGVLEHVAACSRCAEDLRGAGGGTLPGAPTSPAEPTGVPGYALGPEIARGGQGIVHRAVQLATRRTVALKILPTGPGLNEAARRRFERELELATSLRHPGIVVVHDGGVTRGACWIAMELIEGTDIVASARHRGLPVRETIALFLDVCEAIQHAHQRGVIHRDIKPANVLVAQDGTVRVLDFGLAKAITTDAGAAGVTQLGVFVGSTTHASPEQAQGDPGRIDTRSDVYSLGVLLYEMLTGSLPLTLPASTAEALAAIATQPPVPLRRRRPDLDADLETLVMKALAKEPERRFPTVDALAAELRRWLAGDPIEARRDSRWYVLRKTASRHRVLLASSVAIVAVLAGALAYALHQGRVARAALAAAEDEAEAAERISRALAGTLQLSFQDGAKPEDTRVIELLDRARDRVLPDLENDPAVRTRVALALLKAYLTIGRFAEAEALAATIAPDDPMLRLRPADRVDAWRLMARVVTGRHGAAAAEPFDRRAVEVAEATDGENPPELLPIAWVGLGSSLLDMDLCRDADAALARAEQLARERCPDNHLLMASILTRRAGALVRDVGGLQYLADPDVVTRMRADARRHHALHFGGPSPLEAQVLAQDANALADAGRHQEAETLARAAVAMFLGLRPEGSLQLADATTSLGEALAGQGRWAEAEAEWRTALQLFRRLAGEGVGSVGIALERLADLREKTGTTEEAIAAWRDVEQWFVAHAPNAVEDLARCRERIAALENEAR